MCFDSLAASSFGIFALCADKMIILVLIRPGQRVIRAVFMNFQGVCVKTKLTRQSRKKKKKVAGRVLRLHLSMWCATSLPAVCISLQCGERLFERKK